MVRSVAGDLPEQVKNNQYVNLAAGNGGQKMSQYSWFTVYEIEITDEKIKIIWFSYTTDSDEMAAYTQFISRLCDMARDAKRVSSKPTETDNDKYAFRCFLLRLGFIGKEYKTARKILLRNLTGNSAFRCGE